MFKVNLSKLIKYPSNINTSLRLIKVRHFLETNDSNTSMSEKAIMRKLYSKRIDDCILNDYLKNLLKENSAVIAYKGDIRMDYFAKALDDQGIPIKVINLNINPVLNEAFTHFFPDFRTSKYMLFLKGKLVDTEEFLSHIDKGTVKNYLNNFKL
jgi:hypothetical protein